MVLSLFSPIELGKFWNFDLHCSDALIEVTCPSTGDANSKVHSGLAVEDAPGLAGSFSPLFFVCKLSWPGWYTCQLADVMKWNLLGDSLMSYESGIQVLSDVGDPMSERKSCRIGVSCKSRGCIIMTSITMIRQFNCQSIDPGSIQAHCPHLFWEM